MSGPADTLTTGWKDAQQVCFDYLCTETSSRAGIEAFLGDRLPATKANIWCFICSGGREQVQNYQVPTPAFSFYANAVLRAQYIKMEDAMDFASLVEQNMPAYKDKDKPGQLPGGTHCKYRGIEPNVQLFEITDHPELFSDVIEISEGKFIQYWNIIINFRVVYNRNKV
jgi:hypothetical protein